MQLQDLQQRTPHHHAHTQQMETLSHGCLSRLWNLNQSPKSPIFPKASEAKSPTSALGHRTSRILLHSSSHSRHCQQEGRPLSHQADHEQGKDDNDQVVIFKPKHVQAMIMPMIEEVHAHIKSATHNVHLWDVNVISSVNHDLGMELKEGLVWYDNRIYIPRDYALWEEIIVQSQDHITTGYPGIEKTKELILWEYW